ncbi:MAG: hypothetical protein WBG50_11930 [Desulfomonilaceae bacterium]
MDGRTFELEFAKFIQRFHEQIKDAFLEDAFQRREILSQTLLGKEMVEELADGIVSEFKNNIDRKTAVETIADRYVQLGIRSCEEGFSCSAIVRLLILLKRHIWLFFQESNFAGQPFDVRSIIALNNRTALFFDRAIYFVLVGYERSSTEDSGELETLYKSFLNKLRRDLGMHKGNEEQS